jgi:spore germination protein GerM
MNPTPPSRRRPDGVRALALALAGLVALAACGVGVQAEPEQLASENVPDGLLDPNPPTSTTTPQAPTSATVTIYFVRTRGDNVRLARVQREVTDPGSAAERIRALMQEEPTRAEARNGLSNSVIPDDTEVEVVTDGPLATIDLSPEFLEIQGQAQRAAFGQLVWTVTAVPGIERVRFLVDGDPVNAIIGNGNSIRRPVDRIDYREIRPAPS